ncbi:MAG: hypothetical protein H0Z38_06640 [Firmicutes bacterium]|nr:hypothetical protein [Bacillota bacterium]
MPHTGAGTKPNLMILVHERPILMEATIHVLMKHLPREQVGEIILLVNDPIVEVTQLAHTLANYYGLKLVLYPGEGIAFNTGNAVNHCIRQYPAETYIKVDDDIFIIHDKFVEKMLAAVGSGPSVGAVVALAPVSQYMGFYCIKKLGLEKAFRARFNQDWNTHWLEGSCRDCEITAWIWEQTLDMLEVARFFLRSNTGYLTTQERVSIGTVCFTHAHWQKMGGFGINQEKSLTEYIQKNDLQYVIDTSNPVFHFAYCGCYPKMMEDIFPRLVERNRNILCPPADFPTTEYTKRFKER